MGMQLPAWLGTMFLVMTGDGWPAADEDELWALARAWVDLGDALTGLEQRIVDPVRAVRRTDWDGPAADAFAAAGGAPAGTGGQPLAGLPQGARDMADFVYDTGVNVQYMKLIVVGELLILGAQITYLVSMSPWSFGTSTAAVPALQRAGRSFALAAMWKLAMSVGGSTVAQVGLDAAAQLTQLGLRTRKHWNLHLMEAAAIAGAVGGALAPGLGALGRFAAKGVRPLLGRTAADGMEHVVSGAVHEYLTTAGSSVATGHGWVGTPWDLTAGATSGVLEAVRGRQHGGQSPGPTIPDRLRGYSPPEVQQMHEADQLHGEDAPTVSPSATPDDAAPAFWMPPDAPVDLPPYAADGMLGMIDAELTPNTGVAVVDFVNETLSRQEVLGRAPAPDDPGMQTLRQTLALRFEEFLGEGRTFTVGAGDRAVEVTVQAGLTGELSALRQRDDGARHLEKFWKVVRYHCDTNTYTRSREARVATSDAMPASFTAAIGSLRWVRSQPTVSSANTATVLAQHRTRGRTAEWSATADTRWTVRVRGGTQATDTAAPRTVTPLPGTPVLASTSMHTASSVSLSIPGYLGRPLRDPPIVAPAVIDLSRVAAPPRVFSVEGLSGTSAVFASIASAVPDAMSIGSSSRVALREMTGRGHLTNVLDQMLGSWLYSKPLFHDATGRPLGAVRMRASLGQARLLSQTADGDLAMWHTAGLSRESKVTLTRSDGVEIGAGVGGIATAGYGGLPGGPHASVQAALTGTASRFSTAGSVVGAIGLSQQGASIGKATSLYQVDIGFEIQAMGSPQIHRADATSLIRTLTEEALRLDHAARQDGTPFGYPGTSSARPRPDEPAGNDDAVQPPDYLAAQHPLTLGSSMVGEITGIARLHDRLVEALHHEVPDLFPLWEHADPARYADDHGLFVAAVQNYTALADRFSAAGLRSGVNSLLGDGLRLRFRRDGLLHNDYYTLFLNGRLSDRSHQGSTATVRAVDIAGQTEHLSSAVQRATILRAGIGVTGSCGTHATLVGPRAGVSWIHGFLGRYGASSTFYTLSFFPKGVEVFDYAVEFQARLERLRRPRGWRRTVLTWPLAGGWRVHTQAGRPLLLPTQPVTGTMTLWTPQERSSTRVEAATAQQRTPLPPQPGQLPVSTTTITPETALRTIAQPRLAQLSRPYHLEAFSHAPDLLLTHVRRLLAAVSGGEPMMTAEGTPVVHTLAERLSPEMLKDRATAMTGPGGLHVTGPIGDGTYRDWHWSAQIRATPSNWRTVDVVDNATVEEYYAGGTASAITRLRAKAFDASIGLSGHIPDLANGTGANGIVTLSSTHSTATQRSTTTSITGNHERNRSGAGPYVIVKADLEYTVLAQARWRSLPVDVLPRSLRPAVRQAATQISVPDGLYIMMHQADARDAGLLAGVPALPQPPVPGWRAPEYLTRALGLSVLEEKADANWIVDELRTSLPNKVRSLLPERLADDIMGGLTHLTTATTAPSIGGLIDNLYDGGVPIPLRRRGATGAKAVQAVLRLEPVGPARFLGLRADANVESYRQGRIGRNTGTTTARSNDVALSASATQSQHMHHIVKDATPSAVLSSGAGMAVGTLSGHIERIDNTVAATGPTACFALPARLVVEVRGRGVSTSPISTQPRTVLLRIPETLAVPPDTTPVPATAPTTRVRMLDPDQASAEQVIAWKNDTGFTRLPTHHGVDLVWGTAAVRDAAEQAIKAVAGGVNPRGTEFGSQLWSAISNTMLASTMFTINTATDPDASGATPRLRADQIDDIGLPLPVPSTLGVRGWHRIDLRLMANLAAPKLVGATSEKGELVRLEQRRILTLTDETEHTATERHGAAWSAGPTLTDPTHRGSSFGVTAAPIAMAGNDAEATTSGGTGDSYQVHRHATRTYLFTADVVYRVIARHADHSAAAEALVPDGLHFRLTETDALALHLITPETVAKYRPAVDAMGTCAADWRSAADEADGAASVVGQEYRALLRHRERECRHWEEVGSRRDELARFAEFITEAAPAAARTHHTATSEPFDRLMGYVDALADVRATNVSALEALISAADDSTTRLGDAVGAYASAGPVIEAVRTSATSITATDATPGQQVLVEKIAALSVGLQTWSTEVSELLTCMDRLTAARADYRDKQLALDRSTTVLADQRRELRQTLHPPPTGSDVPGTTGGPSIAEVLRGAPSTTSRARGREPDPRGETPATVRSADLPSAPV